MCLDAEALQQTRAMATDDHKEAARAFVEKRARHSRGIEMTAYLRLRHICLATDDLARAKRDIPDIFGVRLALDPHAKDFEVVNAMFPFGLGFIEAMARYILARRPRVF